MKRKSYFPGLAITGILLLAGFQMLASGPIQNEIISSVRENEIARAKAFLYTRPLTVTENYCIRSKGGVHDFYSEGDYWWPDPDNPEGPYIRKDGNSNPDNFSAHRHAMIRLSEIVATLTSAWLLTDEQVYADQALVHLKAWFVDEETRMNPNLLYAQAISGRVSGRGVGLIDAYHLVEVARSLTLLSQKGGIPEEEAASIKSWFSEFLEWMSTHEYGIKEMNANNNHGTCWAATAASIAVLTKNEKIIRLCTDRFKQILLPEQMAEDGSFPQELRRTKPYGYSLFNIDAFCIVAQILSTPENDLFSYQTEDGKSLKKGMEFIYPYMAEKNIWPFEKDIYIWDEWPVRHPSLLFSAVAFEDQNYKKTYLSLPAYPINQEVLRNLPVRHPVIWMIN